jgi:hypothetical protein
MPELETGPPMVDQLTLLEPRGADSAHPLLLAPTIFPTLTSPRPSPSSQNIQHQMGRKLLSMFDPLTNMGSIYYLLTKGNPRNL